MLEKFQFIQILRNFFIERGLIDVITPPIVENPGMEVHIHPFSLTSVKENKNLPLYLHTSPEFAMKELLSKGLSNIFTISYSFRDEPKSSIHRPQFILLEWYRANISYEKIMDDVEDLFRYCLDALDKEKTLSIKRMTIQELFLKYIKIDILDFLEQDKLRNLILEEFPDVPVPLNEEEVMEWEDYYFLLFLNKIEPHLQKYDCLILYDFPHHLKALSNLKETDPRVCKRFEVYSHGIEIANCFDELTDLEEQKKRFLEQGKLKEKLYQYQLPEPSKFYQALETGIPKSSGIALGVERFYAALTGKECPFWN